MKNLIITAALALLVMTMTAYQLQYVKLIREKTELKQVCDEAAAAAALCIDESQFGEGFLYFDRGNAKKKAEEMIIQNFTGEREKLSWNISFDDAGLRPAVTLKLVYEDLQAEAVYEYLPLQS